MLSYRYQQLDNPTPSQWSASPLINFVVKELDDPNRRNHPHEVILEFDSNVALENDFAVEGKVFRPVFDEAKRSGLSEYFVYVVNLSEENLKPPVAKSIQADALFTLVNKDAYFRHLLRTAVSVDHEVISSMVEYKTNLVWHLIKLNVVQYAKKSEPVPLPQVQTLTEEQKLALTTALTSKPVFTAEQTEIIRVMIEETTRAESAETLAIVRKMNETVKSLVDKFHQFGNRRIG